MKISLYADRLSTEEHLVAALTGDQIEVVAQTNPQSLCNSLFRNPDAIGLLATESVAFAFMTIRGFRQADVKNLLVALIGGRKPVRRGEHEKLVYALGAGADDAQPLDISSLELAARLKALSRRGSYFDFAEIKLPNCVYSEREHGFIRDDGDKIKLTAIEEKLFVALARRDVTMTKEMVMDQLYSGADDEPGIKIVDVLVCKLRRKLMVATGGFDCVQTVWGRGFQFIQAGFVPTLGMGRRRVAV